MVASVLDLLGLSELVADDVESYTRIISGLCNNHESLCTIRAGLRNRFENTPLRDEAGFTKDLESACCRILGY
jgi:predicted O-linked N-acetylglucosamine transferase (SPINDLY family)